MHVEVIADGMVSVLSLSQSNNTNAPKDGIISRTLDRVKIYLNSETRIFECFVCFSSSNRRDWNIFDIAKL